jgi:hypothetical protein
MHGSYSHHSYRARLVWREKAITEARLQLARFLEAEALVEQKSSLPLRSILHAMCSVLYALCPK